MHRKHPWKTENLRMITHEFILVREVSAQKKNECWTDSPSCPTPPLQHGHLVTVCEFYVDNSMLQKISIKKKILIVARVWNLRIAFSLF